VKRIGRPPTYSSLYERLVANTRLEHEDNPNSCWIYTGTIHRHYPLITVRVLRDGKMVPRGLRAHRLMLEILHECEFPFDEGGHMCYNPACLNPDHLRIETKTENCYHRRNMRHTMSENSWIPVLFPIIDHLQVAANHAWSTHSPRTTACPF
jgi:hypothetical protein